MTSLLPPKKDVALALLERASVFVHLDPRADAVEVPPWLRAQPQLILQIGLNLAVDIPDLEVDDAGISCTLSFSRRPHHCAVPWSAVYALVGEDGRGMVWPADIPAEVAAQASPVQSQVNRAPRVDRAPRMDSLGRVDTVGRIDSVALAAEPAARGASRTSPNLVALQGKKARSAVAIPPATKAQRSHLRLVK
jgi:stringent starvation protein B